MTIFCTASTHQFKQTEISQRYPIALAKPTDVFFALDNIERSAVQPRIAKVHAKPLENSRLVEELFKGERRITNGTQRELATAAVQAVVESCVESSSLNGDLY